MAFAKLYSAQINLLEARTVNVEVDSTKGLHNFSIVGLPDKAVEESKDRVGAAIKNSGYKSPKTKNEKIIVSLSPADLKKEGPVFDLPIALAYLKCSGEIDFDVESKMFIGELSLNGDLKPVKGILAVAIHAKRSGIKELYVPKENEDEAALIEGVDVYGIRNIKEVISHLDKKNPDTKIELNPAPITKIAIQRENLGYIDLSEIKGQMTAKRGLEIAAAGGHNIAFYGPPGTGKTMLARAFPGILPELDDNEAIEVTGIHSIAGMLKENFIKIPPFRSPHHTSSYVSLIGGGAIPKPGEVTLANKGILFLDEFPEFDKRVIESLRQPLEDRMVHISRAKGYATFPADFILIAAMNPCPCGNKGSKNKICICSPQNISRYQKKISGPIIDRIDIWIEVASIDYDKINDKGSAGNTTSKNIRARVEDARSIQKERTPNAKLNSKLSSKEIEAIARMDDDSKKILLEGAKKLNISMRSYYKIIKLARTIADLDYSKEIKRSHILEAFQYRPKDLS